MAEMGFRLTAQSWMRGPARRTQEGGRDAHLDAVVGRRWRGGSPAGMYLLRRLEGAHLTNLVELTHESLTTSLGRVRDLINPCNGTVKSACPRNQKLSLLLPRPILLMLEVNLAGTRAGCL